MALLQDQIDVLYPAAPTAFTSAEDAIQRLLPYHIYQLWDAELDKTGHDEPPESIAERRQIGASARYSFWLQLIPHRDQSRL